MKVASVGGGGGLGLDFVLGTGFVTEEMRRAFLSLTKILVNKEKEYAIRKIACKFPCKPEHHRVSFI